MVARVERHELVDGRDELLRFSRRTSVELGALLIGARGVDAEYAAQREPLPRLVRRHVAAFEDLGVPGSSPAEIAVARESDRRRADAILVHAAGVHLAAAGPAGGVAPTITNGGSGITYGENCVLVRSTDADLSVAASDVLIEAVDGPVEVRLRYFASEYFSGTHAWATVRHHEARETAPSRRRGRAVDGGHPHRGQDAPVLGGRPAELTPSPRAPAE